MELQKKDKIIVGLLAINILISVLLVRAVFFPSENELRYDYYSSEVATLISPHSLREDILHASSPYVIVDVRSQLDYEAGHIVGAVSVIPGDSMYDEIRNLQRENPDKEILTYCYTQVCMLGRKVGKALAEEGIYVRELGVGFNEWKNFWKNWNYEREWDTVNIDEYIKVGPEPGVFKNPLLIPKNNSCAPGSTFSC